MREDFVDYYKFFIDKYGMKAQRLMCIEEMSELTKELCKLERYTNTEKEDKVINNIREEIADVLNMAEQLEFFYGSEEIEKIRLEKVKRQIDRVNNNT